MQSGGMGKPFRYFVEPKTHNALPGMLREEA
ncbi:MAG: hypothetical protein BWX48_03386 [Verrucomicrobia bacterium ADurb.Bin006]|jgi:hypothetical protein|nr:MAG: hypothetical protein BWX48_03386 [Verrucomicrobia bacterium ADurb.Bin006]